MNHIVVLTHYQTRLAGSVTRGIGSTEIRYEPLPLFGETDTQARYTIAQDLSPKLSFIASSNPREAEAQTYIADVHAMPAAPSIQGQLFTNDQKNTGVTVQQRLRLGRGGQRDDTGPKLRSIVIAAPPEVPARKVRRAIEYRKGDPIDEGASLDVEVHATEALRRQGIPAADVEARTKAATDDRVDVEVVVEPGQRTVFEFTGLSIPRPSRQAVIAAYRPALDHEAESFEWIEGLHVNLEGQPDPQGAAAPRDLQPRPPRRPAGVSAGPRQQQAAGVKPLPRGG